MLQVERVTPRWLQIKYFFIKFNMASYLDLAIITAKNTVISRNFLVWKFCGKAQFLHSFRQFFKVYFIIIIYSFIDIWRLIGMFPLGLCGFNDNQKCQWKIRNTKETQRKKIRKKIKFENTILVSWIFWRLSKIFL